MKVERIKPTVLRVTLGAYELAAMMAAVRWIVEGREGDLPADAVEQLRQVLASYEEQMARRDALDD